MQEKSPNAWISSGSETRVTLMTLQHAILGAEFVAVVPVAGSVPAAVNVAPLVNSAAEAALESFRVDVLALLKERSAGRSIVRTIKSVDWGLLIEPITLHDGAEVGALMIGRHGRTWSAYERSLAQGFAALISHVATLSAREDELLRQRQLDELITRVSERLMSASLKNRQEVLNWITHELALFTGADVAFLRRNDLDRELSILISEWPVRENVPDPDPLGEVRFDSDPVFMATRELRTPYLMGFSDINDDYLERINDASGEELEAELVPVGGAAVPLLTDEATWGILGFIHFEKHAWINTEIQALQVVASLIMQYQGRIVAEERTIYNAYHDFLTGLPNRRAFVEELQRRVDEQQRVAMMIIDIDRFKILNDYMGHTTGDQILVTIADRIRTSIRSDDYIARFGGDEFVFLCAGDVDEFVLFGAAERLLRVINRPIELAGQYFSHTASIGVAVSEPGARLSDDLVTMADAAMYQAKARGGNQLVLFDEVLRARMSEHLETEIELREAIKKGELRLRYQPEFDLRSGKLLGIEALVFWEHPTKGGLAAANFITVAEESGLVVDIGRWVYQEACTQMAKWIRQYPMLDFVMRVNMSPTEFVLDDVVTYFEECLVSNQVAGDRLCIEVTEHAMFTDADRIAHLLASFRALGVTIALDDFGTGSASMTQLKRLPVDILKLDTNFVNGVKDDPYDRAIVQSIIRLGGALDLDIICEGIESIEILDEMLELGCTRGQGYFLSRPIFAEHLGAILRMGGVSLDALRSGKALVPREPANVSG
ncbi:MAG TPA: EAL domain-containing protein [Acidimicrobiales bacterium]|nr:EAL domain-containing protein [Acidimicrobiales bacterium]